MQPACGYSSEEINTLTTLSCFPSSNLLPRGPDWWGWPGWHQKAQETADMTLKGQPLEKEQEGRRMKRSSEGWGSTWKANGTNTKHKKCCGWYLHIYLTLRIYPRNLLTWVSSSQSSPRQLQVKSLSEQEDTHKALGHSSSASFIWPRTAL